VLVTNNQSDLDGATQLEAVLEVHRQNRPDGVELALKLVEIMQCINLQAVAHAFNTPGEAIACSVCKSAAAACSNADVSVEVLLIVQNYAFNVRY
jgi:hypothetical protein